MVRIFVRGTKGSWTGEDGLSVVCEDVGVCFAGEMQAIPIRFRLGERFREFQLLLATSKKARAPSFLEY
jgi:hypothetical protein